MNAVTNQTVVHVHFDGRSDDIPLDVLFPVTPPELSAEFERNASGVAAAGSAFVRTVKEGLANHYDRPVNEFADYIVDFTENQNITVRPKAEFGSK
jgi:tryptophan synthase alpha subunit